MYENKAGCPKFSATAWIRFVGNNPWIIAILLIIFGLLSTFKGKDFFEITVGILGGGLVFLGAMLLFSFMDWLEYLDDFEEAEGVGLAIFAFIVAGFLAFVVGYFLSKATWVIGVVTLGLVSGFFLG